MTKTLDAFFKAKPPTKGDGEASTTASGKRALSSEAASKDDPSKLAGAGGDAAVEASEPRSPKRTKVGSEGTAAPPKKAGRDLNVEPGWKAFLQPEASKPYFRALDKFVNQEMATKTVYPPKEEVLAAFNLCPLEKTKVVIIGQDPYHGPGQAHGLAFSVKPGVAIPPSLRNMFKELDSDLGIKPSDPRCGSLIPWAEQGVFLINTVLTVRKGEAHSHKGKGWETFTDHAIETLSKKTTGLVFLLWGKPAQLKAKLIDKKKHRILTSSHPSPLSAYKTNEPFLGSKCYSRTNKVLAELGKEPINWAL
eukprot:CAMPEP_0184518752 /NCGR_PEP_ID=MMETSP0198_2-20121128/6249_1 /TAXON_ID=1112570 /ORGANISM="Thraustochytrium sp., Strain LLF1b" /LENGTH=306 /DNA_ID=CAMNT_0026909199 /DNA_START=93 /DNA_END=1013 /DNA_ORIENTATION=-